MCTVTWNQSVIGLNLFYMCLNGCFRIIFPPVLSNLSKITEILSSRDAHLRDGLTLATVPLDQNEKSHLF